MGGSPDLSELSVGVPPVVATGVQEWGMGSRESEIFDWLVFFTTAHFSNLTPVRVWTIHSPSHSDYRRCSVRAQCFAPQLLTPNSFSPHYHSAINVKNLACNICSSGISGEKAYHSSNFFWLTVAT